MVSRANLRAFTLVEVVVAIGVFALTIVAVVGLMSPLTKSVADVSGHDRAAQLGDAIQIELVRLRDQAGSGAVGLDAVAAAIPDGGSLQLVASADGTRAIRLTPNPNQTIDADKDPVTGRPPGIAAPDRYFLITLTRQPTFTYVSGNGANRSAFLALTATIAWPYQLPDGAGGAHSTDETQRSTLLLNFALPP